MSLERHDIAVTTDGSGDSTDYSPTVYGRIINVIYAKTDFADGVDFTITSEATGQTVWGDTNINASETVAPRQPIHSTAGAALTYDDVGGNAINDHIYLVNDRVKFVTAAGGDTKTGTFTLIMA